MKYVSTLLVPLLLVTACASAPSRLDDTYGNAVRSMIYNQIADPEAAANPSPDPVEGLDGDKATAVLQEHQNNVTRPEKVNNEINLNIGK